MNVEEKLKELEQQINLLKAKRIYQLDIAPDEVKQRHISEGVRYIRDGTTADKPDEGEEPLQGAAIYFDYQTNILYVWNRSEGAWKSETLT